MVQRLWRDFPDNSLKGYPGSLWASINYWDGERESERGVCMCVGVYVCVCVCVCVCVSVTAEVGDIL